MFFLQRSIAILHVSLVIVMRALVGADVLGNTQVPPATGALLAIVFFHLVGFAALGWIVRFAAGMAAVMGRLVFAIEDFAVQFVVFTTVFLTIAMAMEFAPLLERANAGLGFNLPTALDV